MLTIGVIGYSNNIIDQIVIPYIRELEDTNNVLTYERGRLYLRDGTVYIGLTNSDRIAGYRFDQLIIADDYQWDIYTEQFELILTAKQCLAHSCVPDEFQIINLELF